MGPAGAVPSAVEDAVERVHLRDLTAAEERKNGSSGGAGVAVQEEGVRPLSHRDGHDSTSFTALRIMWSPVLKASRSLLHLHVQWR